MKRLAGMALLFALTAAAAYSNVGDDINALRQAYGATGKKAMNAMIFQKNGYSICVYFDGGRSAMEIFTRDGSVKNKTDITEEDVKSILAQESNGQTWNPVTSKSGHQTWLRSDNRLIARLSEADDAESGAPAKALVIMSNEK